MIWEKFIVEFGVYMKYDKRFSENTIAAYISDVRKLANYVQDGTRVSLQDVSPEDIGLFLGNMSSQKLSLRSQARCISSIKLFFRFLQERHICEGNPTRNIEVPKLSINLPDSLECVDIERLIRTVERLSYLGRRNHCILEVLYGCGLRVTEVAMLKVGDMDFKESVLRVLGKVGQYRTVPMTPYLCALLEDYIENVRVRSIYKVNKRYADNLFLNSRGSGLSRVVVFLLIKEASDKAGINKKVSPHTLRHSYAAHLLQNGADLKCVQELLGVSSASSAGVGMERLHETVDLYHPRNPSP